MTSEEEYFKWLHENCYYINCTRIPGTNIWVAFEKLLFHWSLVGGPMFDVINVNYRYCYADLPKLASNFADWQDGGFVGEPSGWHKKRGLSIDKDRPAPDYRTQDQIDRLIDAVFNETASKQE